MELKNLIPFNNFKRINEATGEFSNTTGFKESLVGRAIFGIFRYFKKGIDIGKLEYYKRKLENEYFAAILRFCAERGIDLKTGDDPSSKEVPEGGNESTDMGSNQDVNNNFEFEYCEILNIDCFDHNNNNELDKKKNGYDSYRQTLDEVKSQLTDPTEIDEATKFINHINKAIKCCEMKIDANNKFTELSQLQKQQSNNKQKVLQLLDVLIQFFKDAAQYCSTYKGTEQEIALLNVFKGSIDADIQTKAKTLITESYKVYEKITSGINKSVPIEQILGDPLRSGDAPSVKVNIHDYLKKKQINSVDEINFEALVKLFRDNEEYRKIVSSDKYLNHASIRKIQYCVADGIIYHVEKTPDNVGINPGKGGKANFQEDTSLKKMWEQKVEFVKSEFAGFFNFDTVDPFRLLSLNEAMRNKTTYEKEPEVINNINNNKQYGADANLDPHLAKLGLNHLNENYSEKENDLIIFSILVNSQHHYLVFSLRGGSNGVVNKVYRYIGVLNIKKMLDDKLYDKNDADIQKELMKYSNLVWEKNDKPESDINALRFFKVVDSEIQGYDFDSIYMVNSNNYDRIGINVKGVRFLYNYTKKGPNSEGIYKPAKTTVTDQEIVLKCLFNNALNVVNIKDVKTSTNDKSYNVSISNMYSFVSGWDKYHLSANTNYNVSTYKTQAGINEDNIYSNKIVLK